MYVEVVDGRCVEDVADEVACRSRHGHVARPTFGHDFKEERRLCDYRYQNFRWREEGNLGAYLGISSFHGNNLVWKVLCTITIFVVKKYSFKFHLLF